MKIFFYILVIIFLQNCSFDNKSGIWENSSTEIKKTDKNFKDFKQVVLENENFFNDVVELKKGFKFPTIISPSAIVSKYAKIGDGSIVMHGSHIGPNVKIGNNCIINNFANIEHGCSIDDNCHISTAVTINGNVRIKQGSFVGSGSVLKENIKLSENSFIKMGSVVIKWKKL